VVADILGPLRCAGAPEIGGRGAQQPASVADTTRNETRIIKLAKARVLKFRTDSNSRLSGW
jgi:hypothetical protein